MEVIRQLACTLIVLIATIIEGHPRSDHWRNLAKSVLEEHGPKQFYSDGFCVEQATDYHYFTCGFLAMAVVSARQEGTELPNVECAQMLCEHAAAERLVITTIRAKEAVEAMLRILLLKVPAAKFAPAVLAVLNERLIRKLCEECKQSRKAGRMW